jgi:hypothetical protein
MMVVNGLTLPASFERFISRPEAQITYWLPKENLDAYGNDWRTFPMEVVTTQETSGRWTAGIPGGVPVTSETEEQVAERNAAAADRPGVIPWITDFSRIIEFARNGTGESYCFDFRDDPQKPSVIFLDGWYWRRVAPDFDTFEGILEPYDWSQDPDDRDEEIQRKRNPDYDPDDDIVEIQPSRTAASQQGDTESRTVNVQPPVLPWAPLEIPDEGPGTMIVNGLSLPASFEAFLAKHPNRVWDLKDNVDGYGHPIVDRYGRPCQIQFLPYDTLEQIRKRTASLARDYGRLDLSNFSPETQQAVLVQRTGGVDLSYLPPELHERVSEDLEAARLGFRFLPRITDYSQIVEFGCSPPLAPFCFDFRENLQAPSVIHMPMGEIRWRRIAPNFETFIRLFGHYKEEEEEGE